MASGTGRVEIPRNVLTFERLMYATLVIGIATMPFNERSHTMLARYGAGYVLLLIFAVGLCVLFIWAIARRRQNLVRWFWLVLFVASLPSSIPYQLRDLHTQPVVALINLAALAGQAIAFYFIFTGDAVPWFRKRTVEAVSPDNVDIFS